jgi:hypothetical protein
VPTLPDYHLTFEQAELEGIEVTMGRLTINELFDLSDILAMPRDNMKQLRAYTEALAAFTGKHVVDWNLTDRDGSPVPRGQISDTTLLWAIRDGWLQGINGGRAPLAPAQEPRPAEEADMADLMQEPSDPPAESSESAPAPGS